VAARRTYRHQVLCYIPCQPAAASVPFASAAAPTPPKLTPLHCPHTGCTHTASSLSTHRSPLPLPPLTHTLIPNPLPLCPSHPIHTQSEHHPLCACYTMTHSSHLCPSLLHPPPRPHSHPPTPPVGHQPLCALLQAPVCRPGSGFPGQPGAAQGGGTTTLRVPGERVGWGEGWSCARGGMGWVGGGEGVVQGGGTTTLRVPGERVGGGGAGQEGRMGGGCGEGGGDRRGGGGGGRRKVCSVRGWHLRLAVVWGVGGGVGGEEGARGVRAPLQVPNARGLVCGGACCGCHAQRNISPWSLHNTNIKLPGTYLPTTPPHPAPAACASRTSPLPSQRYT
jgi:hypothetical protein